MPILTEAHHEMLRDQGYVTVADVVPKQNLQAVVDALFQFLGMDINAPEDWYRPPNPRGGMIEMYQHQAMWDVRQHPRVHQVFSELFGTQHLWVSIDRVGFKPPADAQHPEYNHKGFTHWDLDTRNIPATAGLQGVLCLTDTAADMGGFQCIPGFHRGLEEWIKTQPANRNPYVPDLTGLTVTPIPAEAGTLIIWDSRLAHGNGHNTSQLPRLAQYISMYPARTENEEERLHRIYCWRSRRPPGNRIFPGDGRDFEHATFATAQLTDLGKKLLGLNAWTDSEG